MALADTGIELKGQVKDRAGTTYYDDFGRPYSVEIDRRTMAPVGMPTPRFRAPFYAPYQHLTVRDEHLGRYFIDFDAWIAECRMAAAERDRQLQYLASEMNPNNVGDVLANPEHFPSVLRALGPEPLSERFVRALKVGHPWATGEQEADPRTLRNARGERLFSDAECASLDRFVNRFRPLSQQLADDADEFLVEDMGRVTVSQEEREEFGLGALDDTVAPPSPKRGRPRRSS